MNKKLFTLVESPQEDSRPHCKCGDPSIEEHTCPFSEEIHGDSESMCNCCDECTYQCAMDI
jgi:hypothetical protein